MELKRYLVRKYVEAKSAADAIRREKNHPVDDVLLIDKAPENYDSAIGFSIETSEEEE